MGVGSWTEGAIRPLTQLKTDQAKRAAGKAKSKKEELFGCKSFDAYCKSDRSRFNKAHANQLLRCAAVRVLLPKPDDLSSGWNSTALIPMTKLKTDQAKRAAGKTALAAVKKARRAGKQLSLTRAVEQQPCHV